MALSAPTRQGAAARDARIAVEDVPARTRRIVFEDALLPARALLAASVSVVRPRTPRVEYPMTAASDAQAGEKR